MILTMETESECSCCRFSLVIYILEPQSIPVYNCDSIPINLLGEVLENLSSILFCKPLFFFFFSIPTVFHVCCIYFSTNK